MLPTPYYLPPASDLPNLAGLQPGIRPTTCLPHFPLVVDYTMNPGHPFSRRHPHFCYCPLCAFSHLFQIPCFSFNLPPPFSHCQTWQPPTLWSIHFLIFPTLAFISKAITSTVLWILLVLAFPNLSHLSFQNSSFYSILFFLKWPFSSNLIHFCNYQPPLCVSFYLLTSPSHFKLNFSSGENW